jgi:hypothetical protein
LLPRADDPLRKQLAALPLADQWHAVEILGQRQGTHHFLLCHPDRPEADYRLDFTGQAWLDYIPSLRPPFTVVVNQPFTSTSSQVEPKATTIFCKREWQTLDIHRFEASLLALIDGKTSIRESLSSEALSGFSEAKRHQRAREFFRQMADWDHLQFEIR